MFVAFTGWMKSLKAMNLATVLNLLQLRSAFLARLTLTQHPPSSALKSLERVSLPSAATWILSPADTTVAEWMDPHCVAETKNKWQLKDFDHLCKGLAQGTRFHSTLRLLPPKDQGVYCSFAPVKVARLYKVPWCQKSMDFLAMIAFSRWTAAGFVNPWHQVVRISTKLAHSPVDEASTVEADVRSFNTKLKLPLPVPSIISILGWYFGMCFLWF